jgi:protoheme IX farnesyltransferase
LLPAFTGIGGYLYLALASMSGAWLIWEAACVLREKDETREPAARRLFGASIAYLFLLFAALIAEHALGLVPLHAWI